MIKKLTLTAFLALVLAACGGGDSTSDEAGSDEAVESEVTVDQSEPVDLVLVDTGDDEISTIVVMQDLTGMRLFDAKQFVLTLPAPVLEQVPFSEADEAKAKFEAAGATVEIQ